MPHRHRSTGDAEHDSDRLAPRLAPSQAALALRADGIDGKPTPLMPYRRLLAGSVKRDADLEPRAMALRDAETRGRVLRRMMVVLVASLVTVVVIAVGSIRTADHGENATSDALRAAEDMRAGLQVLALLIDAETGQRGYVLTEDIAFLASLEEARAELPASRAHLTETLSRSGHAEAAAAVADAIDDRLTFEDQTLALARAGRFDEAREMIVSGEGIRRMGEVRRLIDESETESVSRADHLARHAERMRGRARMLLAAGIAVLIGLLGYALVTTRRDLLRAASTYQRLLSATASERTLLLESLRHADRLRTVGQIAASLAHELGTPLATVSGHARLVERNASADHAIRTSAGVIIEQTQRMAKLVRELLDFGRTTRKERHPESLAEMAHESLDMLGPLAEKRQVKLVLDEVACPNVEVDRGQIVQVMTNVIVNAVQASVADSEVRVVLRPHVGPRPGSEDARPTVRVSVVDHGKGITAEELPRIFDPFVTTKPAGEGTGLGLPIARGIVEEHAGWMTVESEPGTGATFNIFLPLHAEPSSKQLGAAPVSRP